jgi:CheY-like chemotaxis protein
MARDKQLLFIDDEEIIVEAAQVMLEAKGFRVQAFSSSLEAFSLFSLDSCPQFDAIAIDMEMPQLTGDDFVRHLPKGCETIPIIFMSGYNLDSNRLSGFPNPSSFLKKPFPFVQLIDRINEMSKQEI